MRKLKIIVYAWSLLFPYLMLAQQDQYDWRAGLHVGLMNYHGDLSYQFWDPNPRLNDLLDNLGYLSYGLSIERRLSQAWGLELLYSQGEFIANDRTINGRGNLRTSNPDFHRSLNARTEIRDFSILINYYFDNDWALNRKAVIAPFLTAGAGWSDFSVFGDLFNEEGQRYFYWSDNTIRNLPEISAETGKIIEQDGVFETSLNKLQTEGKDYKTDLFHLSAGGGVKIRLNERLNLNLKTIFRFTDTDYLDDVSGKFPESFESELQAYASNPAGIQEEYRGDENNKKDLYFLTAVSIHYNFGHRKGTFRAPVIRTGYYPLEKKVVSGPETRRDSVKKVEQITEPVSPTSNLNATGLKNDTIPGAAAKILDSLYASIQQVSDKIDFLSKMIGEGEDTLVALEKEMQLIQKVDNLEAALRRMQEQQVSFEREIQLKFAEMEAQVQLLKILSEQRVRSAWTGQQDTLSALTGKREVALSPISEEAISRLQLQLEEVQSDLRIKNERETFDTAMIRQQFMLQELKRQLDSHKVMLSEGRASQEKFDELQRAIALLRFDLADSDQAIGQAQIFANVVRSKYDSLQDEVSYLTQKVQRLDTLIGRIERAILEDTFRLVMPNVDVANLKSEIDELYGQLRQSKSENDSRLSALHRTILGIESELNELKRGQELLREEVIMRQLEDDTHRLLEQKIAGHEKSWVFFSTGSSNLSISARQEIEKIFLLLTAHARLRVQITGYTDARGNAANNKILAENRAKAVAEYLQTKGIDAGRIRVEGAGEDTTSEPIFARRVELQVFIPK